MTLAQKPPASRYAAMTVVAKLCPLLASTSVRARRSIEVSGRYTANRERRAAPQDVLRQTFAGVGYGGSNDLKSGHGCLAVESVGELRPSMNSSRNRRHV